MKYIETASGSALLPKLIGTYEIEIVDAVEKAIARSPILILDIGCAEGYYAVGMAMRLNSAVVIAYDCDPVARNSCKELAQKNGVIGRLSIRGECNWKELNSQLKQGTLIICDCEGYEWELLDPVRVPMLKYCDMLVELHQKASSEYHSIMNDRFESSHNMEFLYAHGRTDEELAKTMVAEWPDAEKRTACDEMRCNGSMWLRATVKE